MNGSADARRRAAAAVSLALLTSAVVLAVVLAVDRFPRGLTVLVCLGLAGVLAWWGLVRAGAARAAGFGLAAMALAGAVALVALEGRLIADLAIVAAAFGAAAAARAAIAPHVELAPADAPAHPVLFYNPKSGGGKAERFRLADEARSRGIEPIELRRGDDLEELVRDAISRGADGLAMAGGDGSQAIVAAIAAEKALPYACIPAGTRNHFALDLGVDRDDVVGALDAFVGGGERLVDLAEINGRVFVNNVSLGVYAEAVQREGYREAKIRTILDTTPQALAGGSNGLGLRFTGPDGRRHDSAAVILVSNDTYRLGRALGAGTRPSLEHGVLGIAVFDTRGGGPGTRLEQWSAPKFEITADRPIPAGIDGEAATLMSPLVFRSRPAALRVRIARQHPGASPSVNLPEGPGDTILLLARIAAGRPLD